MAAQDKPLVVIVGSTASGKSSLAIDIAKTCEGEIICADARTVYKGMDIGTAKPGAVDRQTVPHWGLDLISADKSFSAADFKQYADLKIKNIRSREKVPFLVGGTGLYVDSVIFDYKFGPKANNEKRQRLNEMSIEDLWKYCLKHNVKLPENKLNKRYVVRAIEQKGATPSKEERPPRGTIIVGISTEKAILEARIRNRAKDMLRNGVIEEAITLANKYGWDNEAMKANIFTVIRLYLQNDITSSEIVDRAVVLDMRLAKRQLTWLKRNSYINWMDLEKAKPYILSQLAK